MGFIARRLIKQNLNTIDVLIEDTNNTFFNVVELPTTLTQGRASFKIFGSRFLKLDVPLKMEMLDAAGNTVYVAPVDLVGEEVAPFLPYRYVTIEVYRPPVNIAGIALLTIVGEINPNEVDFNIPSEFQNTYNVRYTQKTNLDVSTVINTQPILFYKNPTVEATEIVKASITDTLVTKSIRIFSSGSGEPRADLKDTIFTASSGSQEQDDGIKEIAKPNKDIDIFVNKYKYKTGLYGGMPAVVKKRGGRPIFASKEDPPYTIKVPGGGLTAKMQGGTVTIPEHTKTVKKVDGEGKTYNEEITVPKFETKIQQIINDTTLAVVDPPSIKDPTTPTSSYGSGANDEYDEIIDDFENQPLSMSFEDVSTTVISSSIHFNSFLDLTVKNLRPFSGDVYRIKITGKMHSDNSGFATMADTIIESPELLRDTTSPSGFLRTGYFIDQNHINSYWTGSSVNDTTKGAKVSLEHTSSQYIDSMRVSGSTRGANEFIIAQTKPAYQFTIKKNVAYSLSALVKGKTTPKTKTDGSILNEGRLYFHLSGSKINDSKKKAESGYLGAEITDPDNGEVVVLELNKDLTGFQNLDRIEHTFKPKLNLDKLKNTDTVLQLRAESGEWHISDLSLRPAMDTGFSPDEYKIVLPLPRSKRPDKLDIFIEYFDVNNTTTETITIQENIHISGSALVIDGDDNLLSGSLFMGNAQGEGIEAAGVESAYIRTVGYEGFKSASLAGEGGFMMWSGSVLSKAPDNYAGAGLEIHDGTTGSEQSYFKFRTKDADFNGSSSFDVRSSRFFFGNDNTAFVSGSNGNVEISSSNFHLTPVGNITASKFRLEGGIITDDVTIEGTVEANAISVPAGAATPSASITSKGLAKFISGSIAGWEMTPEYISKPLSGHTNSDTSRIYLSVTSSNTQNIQQGLHIYRDNDDTSAGEVKVIRVGQLSDTSDLHATGSNDYGFQIIKNRTATAYENLVYFGKHQQQIAGFDISADEIKDVDENLRLKSSGQITGSQVLFSGGDIGGFKLTSNQISASGLVLRSSGQITGSQVLLTGGEIGGFSISDTRISSSNLIIDSTGDLRTKNFDTLTSGWKISALGNGTAEFENVRVRGTLRTTVFEKETVNAVGGQLYVANSTALSGSADADDTALFCENISGFEHDEIIFAKKVDGTGFTKEFMKVTGSKRTDESSNENMSGFLHVIRGFGGPATESAFTKVTELAENLTAIETDVTVDDADPNSNNLLHQTIRVGSEYMKVTGSNTTTNVIHVLRGTNGSDKATHSTNDDVDLLDPDAAFLLGLVSPAVSYTDGQVIVSTGRYITGSGDNTRGSGFILINANPTQATTPYIDFSERTGSDIYDVRLKTRLGDLSGLINSRLGDSVNLPITNPGYGLASENVYLSGEIKANSGSIGGIKMHNNKLFTGDVATFGSTNTGFYLDSDGQLSLKDKLKWDGTTLRITGSLAVVAGDMSSSMASNTARITLNSSSFSTRVTNEESSSTAITQTADAIRLEASGASSANNTTLTIQSSSFSVRVSNEESASSAITQTANQIQLDVSTSSGSAAANRSSILINSASITSRVTNEESSSTAITQTADAIRLEAGTASSSAAANRSSLLIQSQSIQLRVSNEESASSAITATADAISLVASAGSSSAASLRVASSSFSVRVANEESASSAITTTADAIGLRVSTEESRSSAITLTADAISSRVTGNDNDISSINQTANELKLSVSSLGESTSSLEATASNITSLAINKQGVQIAGENLEFVGSSFSFGNKGSAGAQYISGSNGNLEISSSGYFLKSDGGALFAGGEIELQADGDIVSKDYLIERSRLFGSGVDGSVFFVANGRVRCMSIESNTAVGTYPMAAVESSAHIEDLQGNHLAERASNVWSLKADCYFQDVTVDDANGAVILDTNGFRLFCRGSLIVDANGTIRNNGAVGTQGSGRTGGEGGLGGGAHGNIVGQSGGDGGNGGIKTDSSESGENPQDGGGGGGGGGTGGIMLIAARYIDNNGDITATGGAGGAGASGEP